MIRTRASIGLVVAVERSRIIDYAYKKISGAVLDVPASQQSIRDGKLKALGVSAARRVTSSVARA